MANIDLMLKKSGSRESADQSVAAHVAATVAIQAVGVAPDVVVGVGGDEGCGVTGQVDLAMTIIPVTNHSHISNI